MQAGEKLNQDFAIEVTNPGGHSSRLAADNAIYRLGAALAKIQAIEFPIEFNDATTGFFKRMGELTPGQEGQDMHDAAMGENAAAIRRLMVNLGYNALLRTTCIATELSAGHAPNALPQRATANVNCRIFPGRTQEAIQKQLIAAIGDAGVSVTMKSDPEEPGAPPKLTPDILGPIEKSLNGCGPACVSFPQWRPAPQTAASSRPPRFQPTASPAFLPIQTQAACTASTNASA